ncbi:iron sulfur assembly protein 1 [Ophiocordyceps sinensis CO18]|uniref:Iron-sulfur assembly protein 1 n=1 Tax=Ophiocordyceps sinensis (strain Co18 / CGMCC 3.14243) TaxID=911162 RepID=T5AHR5_OPHSC|nr:iron sulfur assembly protein 1 [Ophiocordyceps sinensis CO18]
MNLSLSVARAAMRHGRRPLWTLSTPTPRIAATAYHSYPLPAANPPRSADVPETPIAQPEPLPRVHETRPPPKPLSPPSEPKTAAPAGQATTAPQTSSHKIVETDTAPAAKHSSLSIAAMRLTPAAVEQLRTLLDQPEPKLIKVGVRNRGCSGLAYKLEYVDKPGAFDEMVEQDGVKVLIDSKALFSIIGSEMDWAEDKLNQRFVFKNPNIKEQCGCGESFKV